MCNNNVIICNNMCVISMCNNNNGVMCENINDNNAQW
jgi:hypothetical protein